MGEDEKLDVQEEIEKLQQALRLQQRSVLQYVLASGSMVGFAYSHFGQSLWEFAQADLADARRLVEKIRTLGAEPTTDIAPLYYSADPVDLIEHIVEQESECTEALQASIGPTGREARSEAIEHRLEHMIMRKQEQIDLLERARREPGK
ncbi:MAG: ferritin-like domain-containing protein [Actinomycetota bacterium]|nr:ferritin-like domain-containing protein [Actinomycetota bacterium]